jgi:hypothetical protein
MHNQKNTLLEGTLEAIDSQYEARDLNDRDGKKGPALPQITDRYIVSTTFGFEPIR